MLIPCGCVAHFKIIRFSTTCFWEPRVWCRGLRAAQKIQGQLAVIEMLQFSNYFKNPALKGKGKLIWKDKTKKKGEREAREKKKKLEAEEEKREVWMRDKNKKEGEALLLFNSVIPCQLLRKSGSIRGR